MALLHLSLSSNTSAFLAVKDFLEVAGFELTNGLCLLRQDGFCSFAFCPSDIFLFSFSCILSLSFSGKLPKKHQYKTTHQI